MRSRNIKPGFFDNEILGKLDPITHLLFAGLFMLADREGRLEDRPDRIKAKIFPYRDGIDINGELTVLSRLGFIHRYKVGEKPYIEVINFLRHQSPHHTEKKSEIPPKPAVSADNGEPTVNSPLLDGENPPDSLIPDSLIHPKGQTSAKAALWSICRSYLGEKKMSLVGKWVKVHGEAKVFEAILQAQDLEVADPVAWITKKLAPPSCKDKPQNRMPSPAGG